MSVFTAVHIHRPSTRSWHTGRAVLGFLSAVARRIADSPLDSTVLRTFPSQASPARATGRERPTRPHAHWHTVTGPDGRPHLEATWH
ncbi:hypothetical protein SAMN05216268_116145 [Streptomyces yunnanensis]|uniref:Uncharacterized protein n=1 Tax=Streptomyces yunnanensis TaxID=156453 RepID=A0A9X8N4J8_9ACTN|nr:hypothetical protein SAMN05216268_116145 [Streptomyces yunnanensis]